MIKTMFLPVATLVLVFYFLNDIKNEVLEIKRQNKDMEDTLEVVFQKVEADQKERKKLQKLRTNLEIWKDTACINCHNTIDMALPINKISISEAMNIVRNGTERTISLGMPRFDARATRGNTSITASELQMRLELLYIKEHLDNLN